MDTHNSIDGDGWGVEGGERGHKGEYMVMEKIQ